MRLLHRGDRAPTLADPAERGFDDDYLVVVTTPDFTWRHLLEGSAYSLLGVLAFASLVVARGLGPVDALLALTLVTAVLLLRMPNRYGAAAVAVAALGYGGWAVYNGALVALAHPTSAAEFWHAATTLAMVATTLAAATGEHRGRTASRLPAWVGGGALAVTLVAAVLAVGSSWSYEDAVRSPGDLGVAVERQQWLPPVLAAPAGGIDVWVDNRDAARHTFTIRALGVSIDLPANHATRISFDAPAGAYRFECTAPGHDHDGIRGTLFVR